MFFNSLKEPEILWHGVDPTGHVNWDKAPAKEHQVEYGL